MTGSFEPSPTLAADEIVRRRIAAGQPTLHLALGEARLPVPADLVAALERGGHDNRYGPVVGSATARTAAAGYFTRRNLPTDPDQVIFAPGSKALLFALLRVLPGDLVLPCPSWVSYAAQAALVGKRVWPTPIGDYGGVPDPEGLVQTLVAARAAGGEPGVLIVTLPDNPTGTLAPAGLTETVAGLADEHGLVVISDEIYRDLAFSDGMRSPAEFCPERTFVTSGLSKSMALGGWRIGFVRVPDSPFGAATRRALTGLASEVWSCLAAPMQHVAAYALDEPADVVAHVARGRRLHRAVAHEAHRRLVATAAKCRAPGGAFYLYPDLEARRAQLGVSGVGCADELASALLERFGVAVLSATAFGDDPGALRFRIATSLLYGSGDAERREALAADEPVALPWIRAGLDLLEHAVEALAAGERGAGGG